MLVLWKTKQKTMADVFVRVKHESQGLVMVEVELARMIVHVCTTHVVNEQATDAVRLVLGQPDRFYQHQRCFQCETFSINFLKVDCSRCWMKQKMHLEPRPFVFVC